LPVARLGSVNLNYLLIPADNPDHRGREPLVMVHGLATNLAFWYPLSPVFAAERPVLLFDLRGHGRSSMPEADYTPSQMTEDLRGLLDYLEIPVAHFLIHSFGGSVTLCFTHRYPERVRSLILADVRLRLLQPQQRPRDWPNWPRMKASLEKIGLHLDEDDVEGGYHLLEVMMRWELSGDHSHIPFPKLLSQLLPQVGSKRTAERWLDLVTKTNARQDFMQGETMSLSDLARIHKPSLAVYGENSPTLATAHALKELWPHCRFEYVPHAGHFFPLSKPEILVTAAQEFLRELSYVSS